MAITTDQPSASAHEARRNVAASSRSFLEGYDRIPHDKPEERTAFFIAALRADWQSLYAELRRDRPVLEVPLFTVIAAGNDVQQALVNDHAFFVSPYRETIDPAIGPFMLSRDGSEINWQEKGLMQSLLRFDDLPSVIELVESVAARSLHNGDSKIELVSRLGRLVPLRIVKDHFGFDNASDSDMLRWSRAIQSDIFRNFGNIPAIREASARAGAEMQSHVVRLIADRLADPSLTTGAPRPVDRLIAQLRSQQPPMSLQRTISNICGLLVGAVETMSQAIIQIIEQILLRPQVKRAAIEAAHANDMTTVRAIVWEALRFNPITTLLVRSCAKDFSFRIASGELVTIKAGTRVALSTGSAQFDEALFPDPQRFRFDRPEGAYMHLGFGPHVCLGRYVAGTAIPHAVKQALLVPGIELISGPEGQIDFGDMRFPEKFYVAKTLG